VSQAPVEAPDPEPLLERTLRLVDVPSVSGDEAAILTDLRGLLPSPGLTIVDDSDAVLFAAPTHRRPGARFVVLAGHVDTVPPNGNHPGAREGESVVGRGAADMKGSLSVIVEVAGAIAGGRLESDLDVGVLLFGREELPITESALLPLFDRCGLAREIDLAIVMEPTANAIEAGCMGNLNARLVARGRAAHSARPWLGRNAIHRLADAIGPLTRLEPRDVEIDGLVYREVASVTMIEGGIAGNVVPDRADARINVRYAPDRTAPDAEAWIRELVDAPGVELEIVGNAPPGPVAVRNPLVDRLREAGDLPVRPKQAWTSVAEFATIGVDAVNFGPGDPQYAHRDDERVDGTSLVRSLEVLRAFLAAREDG
jgi:succinyl-diaminopimelate desuccinylase